MQRGTKSKIKLTVQKKKDQWGQNESQINERAENPKSNQQGQKNQKINTCIQGQSLDPIQQDQKFPNQIKGQLSYWCL